MLDILKTVFLLSCTGALFTVILLAIKPFAQKRLPAAWQACIWVIAAVCMLVPFWKAVPKTDIQPDSPKFATEQMIIKNDEINAESYYGGGITDEMSGDKIQSEKRTPAELYEVLFFVWVSGCTIFLLMSSVSYFLFVLKKRKNSIDLEEDGIFEEVKEKLNIKRQIRVRICHDVDSPMLVGVIFPVIYIPASGVRREEKEIIFRHELMHYRHKDLIFKWFSLMVNAIHWFNPFAYILSANLSQALEIVCDMAVIKNLDDSKRRLYMNTILNLAERKRRTK